MRESAQVQIVDPQSVLEAFRTGAGADMRALDELLRPSRQRPCFALGRNEHTRALMGKLALSGVVDDFAAPSSMWQGLPVVSSDAVPAGAFVINCAMSISPLSASRRLSALQRVTSYNYADLCRDPGASILLPDFVREARSALENDTERYAWIFERLADDASKRVFNSLMAYRLTADPATMHGFSVRLQEQYFEPFVGTLADAVFADCGGFDGDTSEVFCKRYPHYRRIYLFEPSPTNLQQARVRLQRARDVVFVPLGVSNQPGKLHFAADAGPASSVSDDGGLEIAVTTLDAHVDEPLSFIKMDLEGWELAALEGAAGHIRNDRPALAIAVYHQIADMWRIPEYILGVNPSYDLYLRHYTEGWSETVMYFVPRATG